MSVTLQVIPCGSLRRCLLRHMLAPMRSCGGKHCPHAGNGRSWGGRFSMMNPFFVVESLRSKTLTFFDLPVFPNFALEKAVFGRPTCGLNPVVNLRLHFTIERPIPTCPFGECLGFMNGG